MLPIHLTHIVLVKMPAKSYTKLSVPSSVSYSVWSSLFSICLSHLPQHKPTNQLSHHSVPPPMTTTTSSSLDDLLSHSLTFSLRLIPLTMHVPKTDLIFIHGATPPPPAPAPPLSCITSFPNPSLVPSSCPSPPSHLPIAPPRAPPVSPPHPTMSSHAGIWRRVSEGCPPIPSPLVV